MLTLSGATALRASFQGAAPSLRLAGKRHFHLAGQESASFLAKHLPDVEVQSKSKDIQQAEEPSQGRTSTKKVINVLLHADRRPKAFPPSRSTSAIKTHFGPALLGCHDSHLGDIHRSRLGQGDLGILQLQKQHPNRVVDLPIAIDQGLQLDKAFGFLLRMAPIAGMSVPEPDQWKAAEVLQRVYGIFSNFEGIWFTFELSFEGSISIKAPFLEFDDFALTEDGGLFYLKLPSSGSVGVLGYGAGNAVATMDGLGLAGGKPANYLDGRKC